MVENKIAQRGVQEVLNMKCKTCFGEGGITTDNFGNVQSFECPDCKGTGTTDLIQEVKAALRVLNNPEAYERSTYDFAYNDLLENGHTWIEHLIDRVEELEEELNQERSGRESKAEIGQVNP